jgi:hypothetical protein
MDYAKVEDVRITRRRSETEIDPDTGLRKTVGFDTVFILETPKGHHEEQALEVRFKVPTVKASPNKAQTRVSKPHWREAVPQNEGLDTTLLNALTQHI